MAANGSNREARQRSDARRGRTTRRSRSARDASAPRNVSIVRGMSRPRSTADVRSQERASARDRDESRWRSRADERGEARSARRANDRQRAAASGPRKQKLPTPRQQGRRKPTNPLLPLLAIIVVFAATILIFRMGVKLSDRALEAAAAASKGHEPVVVEDPAEAAVEEYKGVEDPWTDTLLFTTGNAALDQQVKEFCDALSKNKDSAEKNAQAVYEVIVQSEYEPRTVDEMPTGADWTLGAAHHYFAAAKPKEGEGGKGDYYEFAAVTAYCLQYFGFEDAIAAPVVSSSMGGGLGSALVFVTDSKGNKRVCDPFYNVNGWMLDQSAYKNVVVEDIGQDLEPFESMGLGIRRQDPNAKKQEDKTDDLTGTGTYSDLSETSGTTDGAAGDTASDASSDAATSSSSDSTSDASGSASGSTS